MNSLAILYPGFALALLTLSLLPYLGFSRRAAILRGEVAIDFYRLYDEGSQPRRLQQIQRHVQNHFEVPPLFYIILLFIFVTDQVSMLKVVLAWTFVAGRYVHSWIHLTSNDVTRRFLAFGFSTVVLTLLWLSLLGSLWMSAA